MNEIKLFYFSGCTVLLAYTLYVVIRYGIQKSFSDSFYKTGAIFPAVMFLMTFAFIVPMLDATFGQWWQFVSIFVVIPIAFVGAAAAFYDGGITYKVHMVSAWSSAIASLVWLILATIYINPWTIISVPFAALIAYFGYLINEKQNPTWWAEYACFLWMIGGLAVAGWL